MEIDTKTLAVFHNPMLDVAVGVTKQMELIRETQIEAVRKYNKAIEFAFNSPFIEFAKSIRQMQLSLAKSLMFAINPLAIQFEPETYAQEAEIIEDNNEMLGISVSIEGRFYLQDQLINTISTNSKHGRLLKLFLTENDNYVTDEEARRTLDVMDKDKGVGYLRRDLKDALKEAGLEINLYREKEKGYRLLGFSKLSN